MPTKKPSPAQLRARANFIKMVKERARLRVAGQLPPVKRKAKVAKVKRKMGKPSPAQLAARTKFVAMVRAKSKAKKKNPRLHKTSYGMRRTPGHIIEGSLGLGSKSFRRAKKKGLVKRRGGAMSRTRQGEVKQAAWFQGGGRTGPGHRLPNPKRRKRNPGVIKMSEAELRRLAPKIKGLAAQTAVRRTTTTTTKRRKTFKKRAGIFGGSGFLGLGRATKTVRANKGRKNSKAQTRARKIVRARRQQIVHRRQHGPAVKGGFRWNAKRTCKQCGKSKSTSDVTLKKYGICSVCIKKPSPFGYSGFGDPKKNTSRRTKRAGKWSAAIKRRKAHVARVRRHGVLPSGGSSLGGGYRITGPRRLPNPKAAKVFSEFRGKSVTSKSKVRAAVGTPSTLAKLGSLRELKLRGRTLRFGGSASLAADGRKRLHVVGARFKVRGNAGSEVDMGEILAVTYRSDKPHIEQGVLDYVHKFEGTKPRLIVDPDGYGKIEGGSYSLTEDGIEG